MTPQAKRRDPFAGLTLDGKYEVVDPIARGGMGRVYRAIQKPLGREVALKILDTDQLEGQAAIEDFQQRFFQEAAACAKLQHPNTVVVYDYGKTEEDDLYIAMELLEGKTLSALIKDQGTLSPGAAIHIALQICGSIGGAHDQGMVHRDLKPSNVMLTPRGADPMFVKVLDFGLVKQEDNGLTQSGALLGTPRYMAPEQIASKDVGPAADIYALGAIIYHMLTGRPPFDSESKFVLLASHMNEAAPPIHEVAPNTTASAELQAVVMRCLRKQPEERYESMEALARALAFCPEDTDTANSSLPRASVSPSQPPRALDVTALEKPTSGISKAGAVGVPTPLPAAAQAGEAPRPFPLRAVALVAVVLGALLAVGGWVLLQPESTDETTQVEADSSSSPASPASPDSLNGTSEQTGASGTAANGQGSIPTEGPVGNGAGAPALTEGTLESDPPGARVTHEDIDYGDAPTEVVLPAGESRRLTFSLDGYESRTVEVTGGQRRLHVRLSRRRGAGMRNGMRAPMAETSEPTPMTTPMEPTQPETRPRGRTDNRDPWAD